MLILNAMAATRAVHMMSKGCEMGIKTERRTKI